MDSYLAEVKHLSAGVKSAQQKLDQRASKLDDEDDDGQEKIDDHRKSAFIDALKANIALARRAYNDSALSPHHILQIGQECAAAEHSILQNAFAREELFEFMQCYNEGSVADSANNASQVSGGLAKFFQMIGTDFFKMLVGPKGPKDADEAMNILREKMGQDAGPADATSPYDSLSRPSPHSTLLARFRSESKGCYINTAAPQDYLNLAQARCEVKNTRTASPQKLALGKGILALSACGGWKNREPFIELFNTSEPDIDYIALDPGLSELISDIILSNSRQQIIVTDRNRIKSFSYSLGKEVSTHPITTMQVEDRGPIAMIADDSKLMQGGSKGLSFWNLDDMPTHGSKGTKIVGKRRRRWDTMRDQDNGDEIEQSVGVAPHATVTYDQNHSIGCWTHAPSSSANTMIAGLSSKFSCIGIDIETGKSTSVFLGHGDYIQDISTHPNDPYIFATAANDGTTRIYDVRGPLPVVAAYSGIGCKMSSVTLAYEASAPVMFTAGMTSENVVCWDIRAQKPLYELATGNNMVQSLAFDHDNSSLYAATECLWMDRMGYRHEYRNAKIKQPFYDSLVTGPSTLYMSSGSDSSDEDEDMDDVDSEDESDFDDQGRCWPDGAFHQESHFGYALDCGEHSLFRYQFKEHASPLEVPAYGDAQAQEDPYF